MTPDSRSAHAASATPAPPRERSASCRALLIVENAAVPHDRRVWQEAQSLRAAGWDATVLAPVFPDEPQPSMEERDGVVVRRFPLARGEGGASAFLQEYVRAAWHIRRGVRAAARGGAFDVIHAANPPDFLLALAADQRLRGSALIFDQHDLVPEIFGLQFTGRAARLLPLVRLAEQLAYRIADVVIVTNESAADVAIRRGGRDPADVFVVRNGPLLTRFVPKPPDERLKRGRRYLLAFAGVMGHQDGVDNALHALAHLAAMRDDWHAIFLGDGDMYPSLVRLAAELGLHDDVEFPGFVDDAELRAVLSSADVALAPDPRNAYTDVSTLVKIAEYMALSRPIVSFDLHETRVTAGGAACLVRDNDVAQFAAAISALLDDPQRRLRMGREGRRRVELGLAWDHSQDKLLAAYDRALLKTAEREPWRTLNPFRTALTAILRDRDG